MSMFSPLIKHRLEAMCKVDLLSQYNVTGIRLEIPKSRNKASNQVSSQHVLAMALYSTSTVDLDTLDCVSVDLDTLDCVLAFQDINEFLNNTQ